MPGGEIGVVSNIDNSELLVQCSYGVVVIGFCQAHFCRNDALLLACNRDFVADFAFHSPLEAIEKAAFNPDLVFLDGGDPESFGSICGKRNLRAEAE